MRFLPHFLCAAAVAALVPATTALAEIKEFTPDMFVMITARYDADKNRFYNDVPKGERTSCFKVIKVERKNVTLALVGGIHKPWWSNETYHPGGYTDKWFSSTTFEEQNPGTKPMAELLRIFTQVPRCPATGTG